MGLVEDDKVIFENETVLSTLRGHEQEEQRMVHEDQIGSAGCLAGSLKEAARPAAFGTADARLRADHIPDLRARDKAETLNVAVNGLPRPGLDALQLRFALHVKHRRGGGEHIAQARHTEVIAPPLQHNSLEIYPEQLLHKGYVFAVQLLLQILCVRRDDRLASVTSRVQDRRDQVSHGFPNAGRCLDKQMAA